jgi:hypothetical protein
MGALVSNFKGTVGFLSTENLAALPPPAEADEDNEQSASTLVNADSDANKENQHPQGEWGSAIFFFGKSTFN